MKTIWGVSDDEFVDIVKSSYSLADVSRKLDSKPLGGSFYTSLNKRIKRLNIDCSHFTNKRKCTTRKRVGKIRVPTEKMTVKDSDTCTASIKRRLITEKILQYKCYICGLTTWQDKPISLQLDHIDGDNRNNLISNLRLLCPNCHSQTDTYTGRKTSKIKSKKMTKIFSVCKNCDKVLYYNHRSFTEYCNKCVNKFTKKTIKNKIIWPSIEELENLLKIYPYTKVGKMLGVSDNAVRKHIQKHKKCDYSESN